MTNRTIWLTPEVERFLTLCSSTPLASDLYREISRVASGEKGREGFVRSSVPPFLSFTLGGRAVFWHGPTDGAFYKPRIYERALQLSWSLSVS
jgi:hypothetical protein